MKTKPVPKKFKRYLTEPDELAVENRKKYTNLTLKELKLQVAAMDQLSTYAPHLPSKPLERPPLHQHPLHHKPQQIQRNPLNRLPELLNTPQFNNGNHPQRPLPHPTIFRASNPLFVVNTLFQMIKEDTAEGASVSKGRTDAAGGVEKKGSHN